MKTIKLFEEFNNEQEKENFNKWFKNSKIVDKHGNPLIVYHGTSQNFSEFRKDRIGNNFNSRFGKGFYFSEIRDVSNYYIDIDNKNKVLNKRVLEVYLSIHNPLIIYSASEYREAVERAKKKLATNKFEENQLLSKSDNELLEAVGYDGVIFMFNNLMNEIIVFHPNQIKSATDNIGTFNPESNDINN